MLKVMFIIEITCRTQIKVITMFAFPSHSLKGLATGIASNVVVTYTYWCIIPYLDRNDLIFISQIEDKQPVLVMKHCIRSIISPLDRKLPGNPHDS